MVPAEASVDVVVVVVSPVASFVWRTVSLLFPVPSWDVTVVTVVPSDVTVSVVVLTAVSGSASLGAVVDPVALADRSVEAHAAHLDGDAGEWLSGLVSTFDTEIPNSEVDPAVRLESLLEPGDLSFDHVRPSSASAVRSPWGTAS
jgi:hypothetical protein